MLSADKAMLRLICGYIPTYVVIPTFKNLPWPKYHMPEDFNKDELKGPFPHLHVFY